MVDKPASTGMIDGPATTGARSTATSPLAAMPGDGRPLLLQPDWPAPRGVQSLMTTRVGGVSGGPWGLADGRVGGLNLGMHCGDDLEAVCQNRARLRQMLPSEPVWLEQVHGVVVADADASAPHADASAPHADAGAPHADARVSGADAGVRGAGSGASPPRADAAVSSRPGVVCAVMVADCMPVLLAAADGSAVGAAHAGWRGLAAGVLEATAAAVRSRVAEPDTAIVAWLGAAIGPTAFEVGDEVRERFCDDDPRSAAAFVRGPAPGKWWADLYALGRMRLARANVAAVYGGGMCTATDPARFYSFRRDGVTGRMAACIWIEDEAGAAATRTR